MANPVYDSAYLASIQPKHLPPERVRARAPPRTSRTAPGGGGGVAHAPRMRAACARPARHRRHAWRRAACTPRPAPHPPAPSQSYQKVAFRAIQAIRSVFDLATGYGPNLSEEQWLRRMIFLETIAGAARGACMQP
jgi:hypothetical protein